MSTPLTLGPFVLQEEIGRGGMARVFSAYHETDGTPVAVKLMLPHLAESEPDPAPEEDLGTVQLTFEEPSEASRFADAFGFEVRAAAQLDHPCITTVYDHGFVTAKEAAGQELPSGAPWLAMELVGGGTLADRRSPCTWPELRQIVLDVLDGLAHAHARNLVHRDVKPGNVLIDADTGRSKLADFGLAHSSHGERKGALADTTNVIGTPAYMAPEQIEARWQDYGPWTDLYAVGAMVWTLATGRPPYQGEITSILESHLRGVLPEFEPRHPMPKAFLTWLKGMMSPYVTGRFQRAADAAWALNALEEVDERGREESDALTMAQRRLQTLVVGAKGPTIAAAIAAPKRPDAAQVTRDGFFAHALLRTPFPASWQAPRQARRHLHGAGLALFEHRSRGLVGRKEERDRLWSALRKVTERRQVATVLLEGASGAGKSTLAEWLIERSEEVGVAQHLEVSHSAAGGSAEGLGPMLTRHFRIQDLDRAQAVGRVVECLARLGVDDRDEAIALTELARPSTEEESRATGLGVRFSGPRERHVLLARHLGRLAKVRPLILSMDDLVNGPDSRAFLEHLLEAKFDAPILILTTVESELMAERGASLFQPLLDDEATEHIVLSPLNREEQSALVRELLGLEPELAAQVESRSGGNPLFAVQLVSDWIQRDLLVTGEEGFRLVEGADARMPDNLAQVWRRRVEQLFQDRHEGEVSAIELAAMLGQEVDREEWEDVCEAGGLTLPKGLLSDLMRRRLVTSQDEYLGWAFAHAMIHEAVMERAEAAGRTRRWASLCADVLTEGPHTIVRRARYLLSSDRTEEALAPLLNAVRREISVGELARARELMTLRNHALDTLDIAHDDVRRMQGEILQFTLRRLSGQIEQANQGAEMLLRRARLSLNGTLIAEALHAVGSCAAHLGELDQALEYMNEAMDIARKLRLRSYPQMATNVCFIHIRMGDHEKCMERARETIFSGEELGETSHVARGYGMLARTARQAGNSVAAEFYLEEARVRFEREGNRNGLALVWNTLGELKREAGDLAGAEAAYTEAMNRFDACGSAAGCYSRLNLAMTLTASDKDREAIERLVEVREEASRAGHSTILAALHTLRLPSLAALEEWQAFELELGEAKRSLADMGLVDVDIANFAELAAGRCDARGKPEFARSCWGIAHDQWTAMKRDAEAEAVARHL